MKQSQDEKKQDDCTQSQAGGDVLDCEQVESRIHDLLDCRLPLLSDQLIRDHITQCDQCAELVVDFGALDESLSQIPVSTLRRLSEMQHGFGGAGSSKNRLHPLSFIVSVASILLVMLTSGLWYPDTPGVQEPANAAVASNSLNQSPANRLKAESVDGPTQFVSILNPQQLMLARHPYQAIGPKSLIRSASFTDFKREVEPLLQITADLPGVEPVSRSVNAAYFLLSRPSRQQSELPKSKSDGNSGSSPDLGCHDGSVFPLCCV